VHHTASNTTPANDVAFCARGSSIAPIYNAMVDRTGRWWVIAAGATNNAGSGGPRGNLPQDGANSRVIGLCGMNAGVGEPWPQVQQDALIRGVAACCAAYGIPVSAVITHAEWAPTRKIDPAGPSQFAQGSATWPGAAVRNAVTAAMATPPAAGGLTQGAAYDVLTLFYVSRWPDRVGTVAPAVDPGGPLTTQQALFDTLTLWHAVNPGLDDTLTGP
jgi:hypothetical protein